ncbi:metallophosphoesterase [Mycolicibacterium sp. PDY-3]|uniref:ORC-CDC6 family AAA ATPase n=1 Tax=Mycolicibacterium sp. PDY-3 TaxID=3376069 RepID=UPI0037A8C357
MRVLVHRTSILQLGDIHFDEFSAATLNVDDKDSRAPAHLVANIARPVSLVVGEHLRRRLMVGDHPLIAICGDFTSRGARDPFDRAIEYLEGVLNADASTTPAEDELHLVPGNHDVDWKASMPYVDLSPDRLNPIAEVVNASRLTAPLTLTSRHTNIVRGRAKVSFCSVNSCRATGAYRQAPELTIDDPVVEAIRADTGLEPAQIRAAIQKWGQRTEVLRHEALDIPLIEASDLQAIASAITAAADDTLHVLLAHHGFLPQVTARINPYSEMVNGGDVRRTLLNFAKPVIYLHGHVHEDHVEILTSGGPNRRGLPEAPVIVVAAPKLEQGYNEIVAEFGSLGKPLGITIKRYRITGGIMHTEPDERISLCGRTVTDHRFKYLVQRLHEFPMATGDQILRWAGEEQAPEVTQRLHQEEIEECIETLCWQKVIDSTSSRTTPFESREYSIPMTQRMRRVRSPFVDHRWENQDSRHFFFLDTAEYHDIVEDDRHTFLVGHRGTGKTTILKALHWEERISNPALQRALNSDDEFPDGIIGCYMNLKLVALPVFDHWLQQEQDATKHLLFSSYVRLFWIELASRAVRFIVRKSPEYALEYETRELDFCAATVRAWLDRVATEVYSGTSIDILSLSTLEAVAASMRDYIWNAANLGLAAPAKVAQSLNLHRLIDVCNRVFKAMSRLLEVTIPGREWTFRMCLDEGEHLSREAALSIRSMVRECESPLIMAVSALGNLGVDTIRSSVNLSTSDRKIIDLDQRSRKDFINLLEGILRERIYQWTGTETFVDLAHILGNPSLNELILSVDSEAPKIVELKERWGPLLRNDPDSFHRIGTGPIYEFMLTNHWIRKLPTGKQRRREASSGYRKYSTQAYFGILSDAGISKPFYAGLGIMASMADNSIRDALIFINECFEQYNASSRSEVEFSERIRRFTQRQVPLSHQNRALDRMGRRKIDSDMPIKLQTDRDNAARLVQFFGRMSHELTFGGGKTDAGAFVVRVAPFDADAPAAVTTEAQAQRALVEAVRVCAREGFFRIEAERPGIGEIVFRMHRSLASTLAFSYRRPSYTTLVSWHTVQEAWSTVTDSDIQRLAKGIYSRTDKAAPRDSSPSGRPGGETLTGQISLFDADEEDYQ